MRKLTVLILCISLFTGSRAQVAINTSGTAADSHAILDISSNTKGLLAPRMTLTERDAIVSPPNGLLIYNTSTVSFQYYNGAAWINITHSGLITGTANKVPRFSGPWGLQNGLMTDDGNGVSLNTTNAVANASSILDITSTNKGVLIPRMTSANRIGISNPVKGLLVYDSTSNSFWYNRGSAGWTEMSGSSNTWASNGNHIYNSNTGNVGINTAVPLMKAHFADTSDRILLIENVSPTNNTVEKSAGIYFGNNISNAANPSKYNGAIKSVLEISNNSRLGFYTANLGTPQTLIERMTITDYGNVGINQTQPTSQLQVGGDIRSSGLLVDGTAYIFQDLGVGGNLTIGGNGAVASNNNFPLKIVRTQVTFNAVNMPGYTYLISGALNFETFLDIPTVLVGAASNGNGNWYQISMIPASATNSSVSFVLYNNGPSAVTFSNVTWQVIIIGKK